MRAAIGTSILVRAMVNPRGSVGPVLDLLREGRYIFLYSEETLAEALKVLGRPRLARKYGLTVSKRETLRDLVVLHGELIHAVRRVTQCRDPEDDKLLELALNGHADILVTGDEDLLVLDPFEGIPIVRPRRFLALLSDDRQD